VRNAIGLVQQMSRLESIKEGIKRLNFNGALLDDINWLIKKAEESDLWKRKFFEENGKVLDLIYEKTTHQSFKESKRAKMELCETCFFKSFCKTINLEHCEGRDYVEEEDKL
jgi:hypothetical protein